MRYLAVVGAVRVCVVLNKVAGIGVEGCWQVMGEGHSHLRRLAVEATWLSVEASQGEGP